MELFAFLVVFFLPAFFVGAVALLITNNIILSRVVKAIRIKDNNRFKELIGGRSYTYLEDWFQGSLPSVWHDRKSFDRLLRTQEAYTYTSNRMVKAYLISRYLFLFSVVCGVIWLVGFIVLLSKLGKLH